MTAGPGSARRAFRPRRRLRASLVQLLFIVAGLVLGIVLPHLAPGPQIPTAKVNTVLGSIGIGVIGVVSVAFSLLFLVVQWSFSNLTPRLNTFKHDPLLWRSLGFAIGLFVFCITVPLATANRDQVPILVPALAAFGVLVALALIRGLQMRAFASVDLAPVLAGIATRGRAVIDDLYTEPIGRVGEPAPGAGVLTATGADLIRIVRWPHPPETLQQLDVEELIAAASAVGALVIVRARIGMPLHENQVVAEIYLADLTDQQIMHALITGHERTYHQDPMFAFRLLADIALRALSPAVNDPATAVQSLEASAGLLQALAGRDLTVGPALDEAGTARVAFTNPTWEAFVLIAFGDTVECATRSAMVLYRARAALRRLAELAPAERRGPLERRAHRCDYLLDAHFPAADFGLGDDAEAW